MNTWQAQPDAKDFLQQCQKAGSVSSYEAWRSTQSAAILVSVGSGLITGLLDNSYGRYIDDTLPLCDALHEALHFSVLGAEYDPPLLKPNAAAFQEALRKVCIYSLKHDDPRGPLNGLEGVLGFAL